MLVSLFSKRLPKFRQRGLINCLTEFQNENSRSVVHCLRAPLSQSNEYNQTLIQSSNSEIFHQINVFLGHLSRHRVSKSYNNIYVIWIDSRPLALRSNSQPERFFGTKAGGRGMDAIIGHIFINKAKLNILHNKEDNYFYIILADSSSKEKEIAKLQYDWVKPGLADLFHTEVPEEYQGQGIAKQLVLAGLDAICKDDIIIRPTCTYVRKVIRESQVQQHLDHIEKGFNL